MLQSFKPNDHHTVTASFDVKIKVTVTDPRTDNVFESELTLNQYNELVDMLKENDTIFVINTAKEKFLPR